MGPFAAGQGWSGEARSTSSRQPGGQFAGIAQGRLFTGWRGFEPEALGLEGTVRVEWGPQLHSLMGLTEVLTLGQAEGIGLSASTPCWVRDCQAPSHS